jgi:hypothetical protein
VEPVVQDGPADRNGADLDDWLAAPSGDQLSLADDWGTIG